VPLAAGVTTSRSVDETEKIGCHGNVPWGIKKLISIVVLPNLKNLAKIGPVDSEVGCKWSEKESLIFF